MRHLYFKLLGSFFLVLALSGAVSFATGYVLREELNAVPRHLTGFAEWVSRTIPAAEPGPAVSRAADELGLDLALFDTTGGVIARSDPRIEAPDTAGAQFTRTGRGWGFAVRLEDGRFFVAVPRDGAMGHSRQKLWLVALALLVIGIGCYPLARKLTRRLEQLEASVARFGSGELSARAVVQGKDEVARLAQRFNEAAERIEGLVAAERRVVANASHELRSPLARIRLAVEIAQRAAPQAVLEGAIQDIAELDALVEDQLLGARLGARGADRSEAPVDLVALARDVFGREVVAPAPVLLRVDERAVRRALRNLDENANVHAGGTAEVAVRLTERGARIEVHDVGPGISPADLGRLFEPFTRRSGSQGAGLGLALVRDVALAHDGSVSVAARPGGGSVFSLDLADASTASG